MSKDLFKTVRFNGYDKEEVLDFIKNKLDEFEKNENEKNMKIKEYEELILKLRHDISDLESRLASSYVENQRLVNIITKHEENIDQEFSKNQVILSLIEAKKTSDRIIDEAKSKSDKLIKISKSDAFQNLHFNTNSDEILETYENRYKDLNNEITSSIKLLENTSTRFMDLIKELENMQNNLAKDISKDE